VCLEMEEEELDEILDLVYKNASSLSAVDLSSCFFAEREMADLIDSLERFSQDTFHFSSHHTPETTMLPLSYALVTS